MAGRLVQLSGAKDGINRQRIKGGADKDALYDLVNGHVDETGAIVSRPGTVEDYVLPAGTKGLCSANGGLVVFSHQVVAGMPDGVTCEVLANPNDDTQPLKEIHFTAPFLGGDEGAYLYVVAEFANGDVYHYWLQGAQTWEAGKSYLPGAVVQPTEPNGLVYRLDSGTGDYEAWTANAARAVGDTVVPTEDNGYYYEVTDTIGSAPRSGPTEPEWVAEDGAKVYEDTDLGEIGGDDGGSSGEPPSVPPDVDDRYGIRTRTGGSRMTQ